MENEEVELDEILNTLPEAFLRIKDDIDNFPVREDDVWLCTYPKSGTTWAQEMIWMILNSLDFERAKVPLEERAPYFERSGIFDYVKMGKEVAGFEPSPQQINSVKYAKEYSEKGPVCIKTHLPWVLLPKAIKEDIKRPKIIYVTRNPKDTCVSYYYHRKLLLGCKASFEDFCKQFLGGNFSIGLCWDHVIPFWKRRNHSNILFIKFEEMIKDLPNVIKQVANFLERPLKEDQVEILAKHLSFDNMKANSAVNNSDLIAFHRKFKFTDSKDGSFIRSGKVNSHKTDMTDEMIKKFDEKTAQYRKLTGFSY